MRPQQIAIVLIIVAFLIGLTLILIKWLDLLGYEGQLVNRYHVQLTDALEIKGNTTIGQTFVAPRDGLQRIDVVLRTYGRRNSHDVTFYLKESPHSPEMIYQETFNAAEVGNNQWHTFEFPPISDSANKSYFFYFASPDSVTGNAITVGGGEGDYYDGGGVFVGGVPAAGDLAFRTYYGLPLREKLTMLGQRLVEDKPSIWGDLRFYLLLVALYVLISLRIFVELIKLAWPNQPAEKDTLD